MGKSWQKQLTLYLNRDATSFLFKVAKSDLKEERSDPQSIHFRPIYQPFPVFIQFDSKPYHFSLVCLERFQVLVCDNLVLLQLPFLRCSSVLVLLHIYVWRCNNVNSAISHHSFHIHTKAYGIQYAAYDQSVTFLHIHTG